MYRISYLLYVVISCAVTLVIGALISWLATFAGYQPSHENNPDLFTPPIANYLKQKPNKKKPVRLRFVNFNILIYTIMC